MRRSLLVLITLSGWGCTVHDMRYLARSKDTQPYEPMYRGSTSKREPAVNDGASYRKKEKHKRSEAD